MGGFSVSNRVKKGGKNNNPSKDTLAGGAPQPLRELEEISEMFCEP